MTRFKMAHQLFFSLWLLMISTTTTVVTHAFLFPHHSRRIRSYRSMVSDADFTPLNHQAITDENEGDFKEKKEAESLNASLPALLEEQEETNDVRINSSSPSIINQGIMIKDESTNDIVYKNKSSRTTTTTATTSTRRNMELMWCGRESCEGEQKLLRERVVHDGRNNHLQFDGPATGQVCFVWDEADLEEEEDVGTDASSLSPRVVRTNSVLLLVKQFDDELVQVAANAVQELTQIPGLQVHIAPDLAAKLKHYHGVDDENIKLYEPVPARGFGGTHVAMDDEIMGGSSTDDNNNIDEDTLSRLQDRVNPDLICTLGGDGLLMHAGMLFQESCPPILCVAGGSLGFLTRFTRDEMVEAIKLALGLVKGKDDDDLLDRDPTEIRPSYKLFKDTMSNFNLGLGNRICISMRMRLDVRVINRDGMVRARFNVLNEVVIDRGASPYLAALECFVDDLHLTTVQADGIIFATPTGSTAYSMAAGGSVVHPAVPGILITPICPHVLSFRSMVFPDSVVLRCYVPDDARADASVAFDGRYRRVLHRGDSVQVQMSHYPVPTINRADHSADWLTSLKENFSFNARTRQKPNGPQ